MFDFLKFGAGDKIPQSLADEDESPMDGEVFSLERLQAEAAELAASHRIAPKKLVVLTCWRGSKAIKTNWLMSIRL